MTLPRTGRDEEHPHEVEDRPADEEGRWGTTPAYYGEHYRAEREDGRSDEGSQKRRVEYDDESVSDFYFDAGLSGFAKGLTSRPKIMKCVTRSSGTYNVGMYQTAPKSGTTST